MERSAIWVNLRKREVALRMALGAMRTQVVRQFLSQGLRVSMLGCMVGLALAAASGRVLSGMLYGVSLTDVATLGSVVVMVLLVSVIASLLPALRAARVEPMQAAAEKSRPGIAPPEGAVVKLERDSAKARCVGGVWHNESTRPS